MGWDERMKEERGKEGDETRETKGGEDEKDR